MSVKAEAGKWTNRRPASRASHMGCAWLNQGWRASSRSSTTLVSARTRNTGPGAGFTEGWPPMWLAILLGAMFIEPACHIIVGGSGVSLCGQAGHLPPTRPLWCPHARRCRVLEDRLRQLHLILRRPCGNGFQNRLALLD